MSYYYLIACCAKKLSRPAPARELYCSQWFQFARDAVEQRGARWGILSAAYNFVLPDAWIQPYDARMSSKTPDQRIDWATNVYNILPRLLPHERGHVILGGNDYTEHLAEMLNAELPLQGMGIGQQLAYLKRLAGTPTLLDAARDAHDLLVRCDAELMPNDMDPASDWEWDNVRFQLQKAIAAASAASKLAA